MSITAMIHDVKSVAAKRALDCETSWLEMRSKDGSVLNVFMPHDTAIRMAKGFDAPIYTAPSDYTDANLADFDDGNITP